MTLECPAPSSPAALPVERETLLFVDDELFMRFLAQSVLEKHGYHVLLAFDGQEALKIANEHEGLPIRLVITDVIMPVMGGDVLAEWLRESNPELKILFTSGYTNNVFSGENLLGKGAQFLPKPYEASALLHKVRQMLDQPK